tara:strand:+ start:1770 stop:2105 length:336 start_codon:yes stop_codon:yes gene_type:complete
MSEDELMGTLVLKISVSKNRKITGIYVENTLETDDEKVITHWDDAVTGLSTNLLHTHLKFEALAGSFIRFATDSVEEDESLISFEPDSSLENPASDFEVINFPKKPKKEMH